MTNMPKFDKIIIQATRPSVKRRTRQQIRKTIFNILAVCFFSMAFYFYAVLFLSL